ncbi:MAG TPA: FAD-dependent oxidoreductase, partial [Thermomicrobiales bacterium]|nr:FAD-dependent oxidoreductase [Thermomicrobiales bacterium]
MRSHWPTKLSNTSNSTSCSDAPSARPSRAPDDRAYQLVPTPLSAESTGPTGLGELNRHPVIVVGAGMAGLVAAVALFEAGIPVHVLEASDAVGGRIRSRRHDEGFILDRGFQVLLDAYPSASRWIDHTALDLRAFDAAALLWTGRRLVPLVHPFRHPGGTLRDLTSRVLP